MAPDPLPKVTITTISVIEVNPPEGVEKTNWLLLTNTEVTDLDQALEKIRWYSRRWQIEIYFKVLKSGCLIEECRLAHKARLERYLTLMSVVGWPLFFLTMINRESPDASCSIILAPHEWQALYVTIHKTAALPSEVPPVNDAVVWIARLDGFLGRKSDGQPGVTAIWRGWQRLSDIAAIWLLAHPCQDVGNS